MKIELLRPAHGRLVRDPDTQQPLPENGARKRITNFWQRRIDCRDVYVAASPELVVTANAEVSDD